MKKIWMSILLLCVLTGCTSKRVEKKQDEDYLYFLFVDPLLNHPIWEQSKKGFYDACADYNVKCDTVGPTLIDTEKMEELFYQGIIQQADGIITQGVINPDLLRKAKEEGIPVILVDSNIDVDKFAFFGKNFKQQAELMLEELEESLGKDTYLNIAIQVSNLNFALAQDQISEIKSVFKNHPGGFTISDISESKSDKVRSMDEWKRIFREQENINVTINFAAESAEACADSANGLGIKDNVFIFGVDNMESTMNDIRNGDIDASIVTSFYEYGYKSVKELFNYHHQNNQPSDLIHNYVKLLVVTKKNVETYKQELEGNEFHENK